MLRREKWVFCLLLSAALAIVFTARVAVPFVARAVRSVAQQWGGPSADTAGLAPGPWKPLNPIPAGLPTTAGPTATLRRSLNPTLAALPTRAHPTVTPGKPESPVCASYSRRSRSPDFIQGTWTDDPAATESLQSCYEWMDHHVLHKVRCAQPGATTIMIVLVDNSRHTFNLPPDLNMETEFVVEQDCLQ